MDRLDMANLLRQIAKASEYAEVTGAPLHVELRRLALIHQRIHERSERQEDAAIDAVMEDA